MKLTEYAQYDGLGLAQLVRHGEISAQELAACATQAIVLLNPKLNAVIETYGERIMDADNCITPDMPFAGVPFLLKDTGATEAGKCQECGSRIGKGFVSSQDAFLTQRYRAAGLNILGRTTLPEFAQAATTESAHSGATRNPWDITRSTGGSSGGAAAAVATGMVPIAHGTDTGGSIRIPAACCGLVGLKPSRGRISKGPALDETLYGGLNTEHVITRTVRDTAAILDATCHPASGDPFTIAPPLRPYLDEVGAPPDKLRIAFGTAALDDPEMVAATGHIAQQLEAMGHMVEQALPEIDNERYSQADHIVWAYSTAHEVSRLANATHNPIDEHHLEPPTLEAVEIASQLSIDDWFEAMATYNYMRRTIGGFFEHYDVLLTPTTASPAPLLGVFNSNKPISFDDFMAITGNFCPHTAPFNVTGQPAISLPLCMSREGLPIGMQFVARFADEATLIRLASALEIAMPWQDRRPPLHVA
ncbi:MAG: amidase [Pseudomonadales bacterium]